MLAPRERPTYWFQILAIASFAAALFAWAVPGRGMPTNFHAVMWVSVPVGCVWLGMIAVCFYRFGRKSIWMLLGAPLALYWPIVVLLRGIPECYWQQNCV